MGDSNPDPTSQINPSPNTGPISRPPPVKNPSLENYNVQQCRQNALFFNGLTYGGALVMWIHFLIVLQICLLFASWLITVKAQQAREQLRGGIRPFFGKIEKLFLASTVMFGAQRYFRYSFHTTEGAYIAEWVITALLGGAALGTTALFSFNSVMAVKGREPAIRNCRFVELETCIVASPLIFIELLLLLVFKEPDTCRELKIIQEWRIFRPTSRPRQERGRTVMERLKAWRKGKNRGSNGADTKEDGVDLESHLMPKQAEQQALPPYAFSQGVSFSDGLGPNGAPIEA